MDEKRLKKINKMLNEKGFARKKLLLRIMSLTCRLQDLMTKPLPYSDLDRKSIDHTIKTIDKLFTIYESLN